VINDAKVQDSAQQMQGNCQIYFCFTLRVIFLDKWFCFTPWGQPGFVFHYGTFHSVLHYGYFSAMFYTMGFSAMFYTMG
jgi:hypothetical protein